MAGHAKGREQRQRGFWAGRYQAASTGPEQLDVAWAHLRAALADVPDDQRGQAYREAAGDLREIAEIITHGELHTRSSHQQFTRFRRSTRRRDTRARASHQANTP